MTREPKKARRDEGVSLILVSLALTALLLVAAVAIDGGQAYANRREAQNAADAAAMAGTGELARIRFTAGPTVEPIVEAVIDQLAVNRADVDLGEVSCFLIDGADQPRPLPLGSPIDICDPLHRDDELSGFAGAIGVQVRAQRSTETFLARIADVELLSASGEAAARLRKVVGLGADSPFIVCGIHDPAGADKELQKEVLLNPANLGEIDPSAIGKVFGLQSNKPKDVPDCKTKSSSFDGLLGESDVAVGEWATIKPGNGSVDQEIRISGNDACSFGKKKQFVEGCLVLVPVASAGTPEVGGSNAELYVSAWAVFEVHSGSWCDARLEDRRGSLKYCGVLRSAAQVPDGDTNNETPGRGDPFAIRLVR